MSEPTPEQQPDGVDTAAIWRIGLVMLVVVIVLSGIGWLMVRPQGDSPVAPAPSPLERSVVFEHPRAPQPEPYAWIDRGAGLVRIPVDRAIDAVVANPALIGPRPAARVGSKEAP